MYENTFKHSIVEGFHSEYKSSMSYKVKLILQKMKKNTFHTALEGVILIIFK